jgi:endonuclease/exonuclease/phosphatase family metal-dependent hydrolase
MKRYFIIILLLFQSLIIISQNAPIKIISWNIKDFGKSKSNEELEKIADIVKDADIIALQEVVSGYGGAQAVAKLSDILNRKGAKWDYIVSDPTISSKYMTERYAFIWKTKNIKIKNRGKLISELQDVIEREPLMTNFYIKNKKFSIINFHSIPHSKNPRPEIEALINYVIAQDNSNIIIAGDFNLDEEDMVFANLKLGGYQPSLHYQKTTLKNKCKNGVYLNYNIDNIYYSKRVSKIKSGVIDFVLVCDQIENARKLSDHLPVYFEFKLN